MACEDEDMETNGHGLGELAAALAKAQAAFPKVLKDRTAKISSTRGEYSYKYADLATLLEAVRKPLADNGLACVQPIELGDHGHVLRTILLHTSGARLESAYALANHDRPQEMGSEITYARRYTLSALLGVASEEDDDGKAAQDSDSRQKSQPGRAQATARPTPAQLDAEVRQAFPPGIEAEQADPRPRFQAGDLTCPNCGRRVFKRKDGSAWFCWQQKGGCGGQWAAVVTASGAAVDTATGEVQGDFEGDRDFLVKAVNGALRGFTDTERTAIFQQKLHGKTPQDATTKDLHDAYLWLGDPEIVKAWRKERAA
jgi:hypothetical protein